MIGTTKHLLSLLWTLESLAEKGFGSGLIMVPAERLIIELNELPFMFNIGITITVMAVRPNFALFKRRKVEKRLQILGKF